MLYSGGSCVYSLVMPFCQYGLSHFPIGTQLASLGIALSIFSPIRYHPHLVLPLTCILTSDIEDFLGLYLHVGLDPMFILCLGVGLCDAHHRDCLPLVLENK